MAQASIDFVFRYCTDLNTIRHFYTDIIGLEEKNFSEEHGYLVYECSGFQLIFNKGSKSRVLNDFSNQPGQNKGVLEETSFAIRVPESAFENIVNMCKREGFPALFENIRWNGYWSYITRDSMGVTVDIYFEPEKEPELKEWQHK